MQHYPTIFETSCKNGVTMDALPGILVVLSVNIGITFLLCWFLGSYWETLRTYGNKFDRAFRWGVANWCGPSFILPLTFAVFFIYVMLPTSGISETTQFQQTLLKLSYALIVLPIIGAGLLCAVVLRGEQLRGGPTPPSANTPLDEFGSVFGNLSKAPGALLLTLPITFGLMMALSLIRTFAQQQEERQPAVHT